MGELEDIVPLVFIPLSCVLGIIFAIWLWKVVARVQLVGGQAVVRSQNGREVCRLTTLEDLVQTFVGSWRHC